jgi:hypothetical protein
MGGTHDHIAEEEGFRKALVVMSPEEAAAMNLEIDHDDTHARDGSGDLALLIHGVQKAGTASAAAIRELKRRKVRFAYSPNQGSRKKLGKSSKVVDAAA